MLQRAKTAINSALGFGRAFSGAMGLYSAWTYRDILVAVYFLVTSGFATWFAANISLLNSYGWGTYPLVGTIVSALVFYLGAAGYRRLRPLAAARPVDRAPTNAPVIVETPRPAKQILTAQSLTRKQKALDELSEYIETDVQKTLLMVQHLRGGVMHELDRDPLWALITKFKKQVGNCVSRLDGIFTRYGGLQELSREADWGFFNSKVKPPLEEYMQTIDLFPEGASAEMMHRRLIRHPATYRFETAVDQLAGWMNEARKAIEQKRIEYDAMEVR